MANGHSPAKIALLDIETAPNLGWVWGKWEQNVIDFKEYWYMLSFSTKWLGEKETKTYKLPDFRGYASHKEDDSKLVTKLWGVLDEADIIIAHNGDKFDIKKSNARFISHGLQPPSPYKTIDTLKIARRNFAFTSNKLDDLGHYLGVGRKLPHTGARLWLDCMRGVPEAWTKMAKYNAQDVNLLERVYLKLRPWTSTHPDLSSYSKKNECPTCGGTNLQHRGHNVTKTGRRDRFQCMDCGSWSSGLKHTLVPKS
jgi:DNA polymerase elongation subunit (family B)